MTIGYIRVSTEEQSKEGFSLENQQERISAYCAYNNIGTPLFIEDKGVSGKRQSNRDGFQDMLTRIKSGAVSNVVVYSLSRIGRNTVETLQFIDEMNKQGVTIHSLSEKLDTSSAMGKFFLTILSALCELESGQLGERVSSVLQNNKSNGKKYCKKITGFDVINGALIPNKDMDIIRSIFKHNLNGRSAHQIATMLNRLDIKTVTGKPFRHSGISKILGNNIYKKYL